MKNNDENDEILDISSNEDQSIKSTKYKDRKIDHRLTKYEAIIKNVEKINRINESEYLFVGNCGLANNVTYEFLNETFNQFGKLVDIIMQKKKSYAFIIYEDKNSTKLAIENLQSQIINTNSQTPICFYLFAVDKVPDLSLDSIYKQCDNLPDGLKYFQNFIDDSYAQELVTFLETHNTKQDLKKRCVKHFGYEFRYGTSDCDENKPLTDPDLQMPKICDKLIEKMLNENLIKNEPDQMTVNFYEPGQGIPPHIDNVVAFDEFIISLSLCSSVLMEFRQAETKKFSKLNLEPNSLLVLTGDSRYKWSHLIAERKHDLVLNNDECLTVRKREKRISLTFRKIVKKENIINKSVDNNVQMKLPETDLEAQDFEKSHVHTVYNEIADHFSHTRHSAWPGVTRFIDSMESGSTMLDVGCGNGKYLNLRKDLITVGCDYSDQLISICQSRNFNCFVSDCLKLPCATNYFDYVISIAVLHHLSTMERRVKALKEMCRILKPGGQALVTVWAKEQKYKNKESYYISQKKETSSNNNNNETEQNPLVHKFGKEFEKKDLFVAWHYNPKTMPKNKLDENSNKLSISEDTKKEEKVYLRFYHVFENQELESLFKEINQVRIIESFYEQGNWCIVFEKDKI